MTSKLVHIILGWTILLSSVGFSVSDHICQGQYQKSLFLFSFGSCCSSMESSPCSTKKLTCEKGEEKKGCCENEIRIFKLDQNQYIDHIEFAETSKEIKVSYALKYDFLQTDQISEKKFHNNNYFPPIIVYDRQVRLQRFLC